MSGARTARIAVFAAVIAAFGTTPAIAVPGSSVPITLQTLAVMLTGLMLPVVDAFLAGTVFVALLLAGLPLMPGGFGGVAVLSSPRGGFALGFPIAAAAVAIIAGGLRGIPFPPGATAQVAVNMVAAMVGGIAVLYAVAIPLGATLGGLPMGTFARALGVFIPGDIAKGVTAAVVAAAAFRAAPFLRPELLTARR